MEKTKEKSVKIKITSSEPNKQFSEVTTFHEDGKKTSFFALIFNKEKLLEHQKALQTVTV